MKLRCGADAVEWGRAVDLVSGANVAILAERQRADDPHDGSAGTGGTCRSDGAAGVPGPTGPLGLTGPQGAIGVAGPAGVGLNPLQIATLG